MNVLEAAIHDAYQDSMKITIERVAEILHKLAPIYRGQDGEFAVNNAAEAMRLAINTTSTSDD